MVFERYGISPQEAHLRGMKLIEYLEVESPDLCKEVARIDKPLKDWIEKFEIIWSIPIVEKYAETRRLNEVLAFREILQNALDAEQELYGYENIKVEIFTDKLGTHVVDRGKGLSWRAFLIGRSEKPKWVRGRFGEGLDLATLVFGIKGIEVYFFTKDIVFKTIYNKKYDVFLILLGKSKKYVDGTHVLIYKWGLPKDVLEKIYWKNNPKLELLNTVYYTPYDDTPKMPNMVFRDIDKKKKLYVRDIFVNYSEKIVTNPFYYSYNLWWVELDPNRTNVYSTYELGNNIKRVLLQSPDQLFELIQKHLERKSYGGITYYTLEKITEYYEGSLDYDYLIRDFKGKKPFEILLSKLKELFKKKQISAVTHLNDFDAIPVVNHEGGTVLLAPRYMVNMFSLVVPKAHDFISKSVKQTVDEAIVLRDEELSLRTLMTFGKFRLLADYLNTKYMLEEEKAIKVIPIKGRSHATPGGAYVDINERSETFVHEIAHALGFAYYGDAPDVSENFERCLEMVASTALEMAVSYKFSTLLKKVELGCVYARHEHIPLSRKYSRITYYFLRKDNDMNPSLVLFGLEKGGEALLIALDYTMLYLIRDRIYEEPFLKGYYAVVDPVARFCLEALKAGVHYEGDPEAVHEKVFRDMIEGFESRYRKLDFLAYKVVGRIIDCLAELKKFGGNKVVVFIYDVKKDEYVLKHEEYI